MSLILQLTRSVSLLFYGFRLTQTGLVTKTRATRFTSHRMAPTQATQPTQTQATQPLTGTPATGDPRLRILQLVCTTGQYPPFDIRADAKPVVEEPGMSPRQVWWVGRSAEADLHLTTLTRLLSRHFKIYLDVNDKLVWIVDILTNGTKVNGKRLVKGQNYMLNQGDEILVGFNVDKDEISWIVVFSDEYNPQKRLPLPSVTAAALGIYRDYEIKQETIGQGAFATVKKCVQRSTGTAYAVKIINRRKALNTQGALQGVDRELEILRQLDHPHIVRLQDYYEDQDNYYIVMELVPGGDLMDFVAANGSIGEEATQVVAKQILEGIAYVHSKGISHRDLKPDNILIAQDDPIQVKITDFGLAKFSDGQTFMKTFCGTLAYVAPEVITGARAESQNPKYLLLVDMWLLGCLIYVLLTSHLPFNGKTQPQLFQKIKLGEFHEAPLKQFLVSDQGIDFLRRCLQVDPSMRITAKEALHHAWIEDAWNEETQLQKVLSLSQLQLQQQRRFDINLEASMVDDIMARALDGDRAATPRKALFKKPARVQPRTQPKPLGPQRAQVVPAPVPARPLAELSFALGPSQPMPKRPLEAIEETLERSSKRLRSQTPLDVFITLNPLAGSQHPTPIHIRQGVGAYQVGRNATCDTILLDERLSKIHCIFSRQRHPTTANSIYELPAMCLDDIWLLDVLTNSCYVNDMILGKGKKVKIYNGDKIFFFIDHNLNEQLGFEVIIRDATGLFCGGERVEGVNDDQKIIPQDAFDASLKSRPVQDQGTITPGYGGTFNEKLRKQRRQDLLNRASRISEN